MNIIETTYQHISGSDELPIYVLRIEPEDPKNIKGIVQMVHGKNEYTGRYTGLMRYLAEQGYLTIVNDHRGHGESVLDASDRGYWYEGGFQALVEDLHEITQEVKQYAAEKCGRMDLPFTMLGHSMGSLAARCYIRKYDTELDKLCIIGCPSRSSKMKQGIRLLKFLELVEGKHFRSRFAKLIIMGSSYEFKYRHENLPNAWTNSDRAAVIEHNNDPMCRFLFTLSAYEEMLRMAMLAYDGNFVPQNPGMAIRFFSGADDPCALSKTKIAQAMYFLKEMGYYDIRGRLYHGMRHDILHEKDKSRVYRDLLAFIES